MQVSVTALLAEKCFISSKVGPNLSEMEVRTFVTIQKVIWDYLLASKAYPEACRS